MKTKLKWISKASRPSWFRRSVLATSMLALVALLNQNTRAADEVWDGGTLGTGTGWITAVNWNGDIVPTSADNAIFDSVGTVTTCAIDMGTAGGTQPVGSVTLGSGRGSNLSIRNLTTSTTDGTLMLNGVGGILLSNASAVQMIFTNASTGKLLNLGLATSGNIYANSSLTPPTTAGQISIYSTITESGGSRSLTKVGPGILYLRGTNTYSGSTTVSSGTLEVDDVGTIGNGTGTLFLSGGNLQSGASRNGTSTTPVANPIVLTTDAYIYNTAGTAGSTRFLALSGSVGGSGGTLKIANPSTVGGGNVFAVRFFGGFTNSLPVLVGETSGAYQDNSVDFSVLEMANYPSNGVQTWNGNFSGVGSLLRISQSTLSIGGTAILTGNNTYSGGTLINSGTLFANNSAGSALGSGAVTVTNLGTLAGNGSVVAATLVSLNGTLSPGSTTNGIANLAVSDLTLGAGANYTWQISSATGVAGTAWDLVTCSSGWTDAGSSGNPITIKIDSLGAVPTGWSSVVARDWVIIQSGSVTGFDVSHYAIDTTSFSGTIGGVFSLSVVANSLHLIYTPAADTVINVPSGSVTQGQTSPTPYPNINVAGGIVKVGNGEVVLTNALNSYPGSTKIYAGTASLSVDALNGSGAFGAAATAVQLGNTSGNSNATLNINVAGVTMGRSVLVQSGSSGLKTIGTTISSGTATYSGDVTLQDNATLNAATGSSELFSGNFTGTGGLTLGGGGTITMSAVNSYSGTTTLTGGTLNLNAKALGTNTFTISAVSTLDNTSSGSVTLNDCPQNWNANFSFGGTANLNLGGGPVTMNANRTLTISNSILTVGGAIAGSGCGLTKVGPGELSLTAATTNSYTGGTTNLTGILAINGSATFGDGTGPLVFFGGNLRSTGTRAGLPIANPVFLNADTTIYGDSTATAPSTRIMPFTGAFTMGASTLKIGNTGSANNTFILRFQGGNYSTINWPIVIGDPAFDTAGAISELDLWNNNTTPVQTVSGLISGSGSINRGATSLNTGGTTILTAQNIFPGGVHLDSGAIGFGASSVASGGTVLSGPLGTGNFTLGANNGEASLTIFPSGGARVIDNRIVLNGITNVIITGTNDLTLTGPFNSGGTAKTLTVLNTGITTISGVITNTGTSSGGALTKVGTGILVLSGNNTYPGTTTVSTGKLFINNTSGSGTGTNTVTANSAGTLGGSGTIAGSVVATTGGSVAPGYNVGTLTLQSGLDLSGGGALLWNLGANSTNNPGTDFSQLAVTGGTLNLGGSSVLTLAFINSATVPSSSTPFWQTNHVWRIATVSGGATVSGNFAGISNGSYSAGTFTTSTDANGVLLTFTASAVPATPPAFGSVSLSGNTLSLYLTNGSAGSPYQIVTATNLTQSIATWTVATNGTFSSNGSSTNGISINPADVKRFYRVKE